jgi:signal transduction histidine kinase
MPCAWFRGILTVVFMLSFLLPAARGQEEVGSRQGFVRLKLDTARVACSGRFAPTMETQEVFFDKPVHGRYFCLESLSAHDGRAYAAVAELDLLDASGNPMECRDWIIVYADSEEHERETGLAWNAMDGRPETYWHTQWNGTPPGHPHHLVLDMGATREVSGFRYLPRQGSDTAGGRIRDYRVYVGDNLVDVTVTDNILPKDGFLFGYFTGNGEDGLHLAFSLNGYRWDPLNYGQSLLRPEVGEKLMRDPCIVPGPDGTFHMVWTAGWSGNYIGYAFSKDLIYWSEQKAIPVMTNQPGTQNCWAPEIYWDGAAGHFLLFWASTVISPIQGAQSEPEYNRIYCATTKDFKTFTPTKLFFDPGYGVLDATLTTISNRFYLIFKDSDQNQLQMAVGEKADGPFGNPEIIWPGPRMEGPSAFQICNQLIVCYHIMMAGRTGGAVRTADLQHWEDVSAGVVLPPGSKQGAVLKVTDKKLGALLQAGLLEIGPASEALELGLGNWIWTTNLAERQSCRLWRSFAIPPNDQVVRAVLRMTADNSYTAYLDGQEIGRGGDANSLAEYDLTWLMTPGHHVLAVEAFNDTMDAGMIAGLKIKLGSGKTIEILSDPSWRVASNKDPRWKTRAYPDPGWGVAQVVGYGGRAWWQRPTKITQVPPVPPQVVHLWQEGWVLVVLLLVCLAALVLWMKQEMKLTLQKRANQLLERERARIARDMHDDLGSGLTQLTLLGELLLREPSQQDGASRRRLEELCRKARGLLRSMDEMVWAVNPRRDTVKDFAAFVSEFAQEYLGATSIRCRQEMAEELPAIPMDLPQRRNLLLAVKEAIRNSARHSGATEMHLKLSLEENTLKVVIWDNGRGFSPTDTRIGSNGMVNMKQRLADICGNFILDTAPGQGCRITFLLPLAVRK